MPSLLANLYLNPKGIAIILPLILVLLTAIAGYAFSQIRTLSLPIPQALGLLTVLLPFITGLSTHGAYSLIKRSNKNAQYQLTIPLIAVIGFQLIYETIIATLSLTYVLPPNSLGCGLNDRWQTLWLSRNENAAKAIQDAFNCCGYRTVNDRAWPFRAAQPSPCAKAFGRSKSCFGEWRKAEQMNAGLYLLVAAIVFLIKVVALISLLTTSALSQPAWNTARDSERGENGRATTRRLIEQVDSSEQYRDDPQAIEPSDDTSHETGSRVQPSPLMESENAWRGDGEAQRV